MFIASLIILISIAILHIYFLVLEMFLWDKPIGLKTFKQTKENAKLSKVLAGNQGLYNGFLAAGLVWGSILGAAGFSIQIFFLLCVLIAGIYGGITVNRRIMVIQAVPAIIGIVIVLLAR